jgi:two-component system, OmpR family, sensor histidine kinase CiaH
MATKRRPIFIIFWGLLIYITAALIWWFLLLTKQNNELTKTDLRELRLTQDSVKNPIDFSLKKQEIIYKQKLRNKTYIAEGLTFLVVIIVGAILVFRLALKQFKLANQQQNFMMAVTHELKTPIAVAQINLQTLRKHQLQQEKQHQIIDNTLKETKRLDQLASNILIASKLDGGGYTKIEDDILVDKLVLERMQSFETNYPNYNFETDVKEECTIQGDQFLFQILVDNLISNAIKYSKPNTRISAQVFKNGFAIKDQGQGIPLKERKKVFEKFVRLGNEDTRNTKGTGIGLYLCNRIVKDLKGSITINDNTPNGSIFTIIFKQA